MRTKIAEIPENTQVADSDADRKSPEKASVGAHKPRVAPTKAKSAKKATPAKKGRNAPKPAKLAKSVAGAGEGSQTAPVARRRADIAPSKAQLARKATGTKKAAAPARRGSKTAKIVDLLKRPGGVTLKELMKATGWQPHSVRGFLSGTVGKKMGVQVESFKGDDQQRAYRISSK